MLKRVPGVTSFFLLLVSELIRPAAASGIALREGSVDWLANAFAGRTAKAYDASTSFSNPAGMTALYSNEIDLSSNLIAAYTQFKGSNRDGFGGITPGAPGGNAPNHWWYPVCLEFGIFHHA